MSQNGYLNGEFLILNQQIHFRLWANLIFIKIEFRKLNITKHIEKRRGFPVNFRSIINNFKGTPKTF